MLLVANAGLTVSEFAGAGAAMEIFGVSPYISIPIAAVAVWGLTVLGSYSRAERLFLILTLAFLTYPIAAFLAHPNGKQVVSNLVWPHFLATHSFLVGAVALIGTTITPYMQFYVASAVVDKGVKPADYSGERIDTVSGAIWSDVISIFIIIATAAAIGGSGALQSAQQAAEALKPVVGAAAPQLFAFGLLGASLLAASVVPLSTSYAIADAVGAPRSVSASFAPGASVLRHLYVADRGRRGGRACPGQPRGARRQRAGPQRHHHAAPADLRPDPGEPVDGAGRGGQRAHLQEPRIPSPTPAPITSATSVAGQRAELERQDAEEAGHERAQRVGHGEQDSSVTAAPSRPTRAPSKMNGQRMNASEAPTRRMISISSARATTASRIVLTMMNRTISADQDEQDQAAGPQDVGDGQHPVDQVLDL